MHDTNPTIHMPFLVYWNVKSTIRPRPASVSVPCSCAHHKACYAARIRQLYLLLRSRGTGVRYRARDGAARPSRPVPDYSARRLPVLVRASRLCRAVHRSSSVRAGPGMTVPSRQRSTSVSALALVIVAMVCVAFFLLPCPMSIAKQSRTGERER